MELDQLKRRLQRLERSHKRLKRGAIAIGLVAAVAFGWMVARTGSANPFADQIHVRRIVLETDGYVGELTAKHVLLGKPADGYDQAQWPVVLQSNDGVSPALTLGSESGRTFLRAGTAEFSEGASRLEVYGGLPQIIMLRNAAPGETGGFGQADYGSDFVRVIGEGGRASLSAQAHGRGVVVQDPKGNAIENPPK